MGQRCILGDCGSPDPGSNPGPGPQKQGHGTCEDVDSLHEKFVFLLNKDYVHPRSREIREQHRFTYSFPNHGGVAIRTREFILDYQDAFSKLFS